MSEGALKDALSHVHTDVKKVNLKLNFRLHFKIELHLKLHKKQLNERWT